MKFRLAAVAATVSLLAASPAQPAPMPFADAIFPTGLPHALTESTCATYRCVWAGEQSVILTRYQGGFIMKPISHERAVWLQAQYCDRPSVNCDYKDN
jgi:hypothetical protein